MSQSSGWEGAWEVRVLGPAVSPGSPELFLYSCQALARLILLVELQARVIYLPPDSGWGQGPGPTGKHIYWSTPSVTGPTLPGACKTWGGKGGSQQEVWRKEEHQAGGGPRPALCGKVNLGGCL